MHGRDFVIADDIKRLVPFVFIHRLMPTDELGPDTKSVMGDFVHKVLDRTSAPVAA